MRSMIEQYGKKKGESVFYASENKGVPGSQKWTKSASSTKSTPDPQYGGPMKAKASDLGLNPIKEEVKKRAKK